MNKLTEAQRKTLQAVYDYEQKYEGKPPTLKELREVLDLSSNQGVVDSLKRLESKGLVFKQEGEARGIQTTNLGKAILGHFDPDKNLSPLEGLSKEQLTIYEKLQSYDQKIADTYLGSIRALEDKSNPDYIAQSAHSLREAIGMLSDLGKVLIPEETPKVDSKRLQELLPEQLKLYKKLLSSDKHAANIYLECIQSSKDGLNTDQVASMCNIIDLVLVKNIWCK